MRLSDTWIQEFWRLSAMLCVALIIGILINQVMLMLLVVCIAYIIWQLIHLSDLDSWLDSELEGEPRHARGVWDQIFSKLYRIHQKQKKRRSKLKKQLGEFQKAAEALPDAVVVLDSNLVIERFNPTATYLLGLQAPQDHGQRILNLVRNPIFTDYIASGNYEERIQITSPINENIIISIRIVSYGGGSYMLVARDVTYMERLKTMRRDFLANVSHELRTPITVVSGYMETIKDMDDISKETLQKPIGQILQQTSRMESLISDLLQLAKLESSATIAPNDLVDVPSLMDTIKNDTLILSEEKHHTINVECDREFWLTGDEMQLYSAFSNLASNAVRYTPDGGKITLRWYIDNEQACFEVQDSGIGIAGKFLPRLTERFFRVDIGRSRHSGGTGLGLAIVKHILERHQAHLLIESKPDAGSTFRCIFPRERITAQRKRKRS